MRRVGRFLLLVGFGVVVGLLTLLLVDPRREDPISAPMALNRSSPAASSATATRSRPIATPSADAPSSPGAAEPLRPNSERETIAESAPVPTDIVVLPTGAHVRLDEIPAPLRQWAVPRDDISSYPPHWCFLLSGATIEAGDKARLHVALDSSVVAHGSRSARVDTRASLPPGVTAVMWQAVDATSYKGSRLELVAQVRSEAPVARLFLSSQSGAGRQLEDLRTDLAGEPGVNQSLASGTDWTRVAVVHDVPFDAFYVYYGVALYGNGSLWLDDVRLTVVETSVPLTHDDSADDSPSIPIAPVWSQNYPMNLDFELRSWETGHARCAFPKQDLE